jgi:hypothetical protein
MRRLAVLITRVWWRFALWRARHEPNPELHVLQRIGDAAARRGDIKGQALAAQASLELRKQKRRQS